uniref:Uncharacterized protein n=1 Tax=Acrobeloides nanus TaxID=290746 RepID=A0A914C3D6_9BILA
MNPAVKSVIYTMLDIITSYLVSNTLHLVLSVLKRSYSHFLKNPKEPELDSTFHTVFSDLVSFVYMFTSAIRLVI